MTGNLTFGPVPVGSKATATMTITNSGNAPLSVTSISQTSGLQTVLGASWTNGTVAPGGSQQVTIEFSPTAVQTYNGTVTVSGDQTSGTNSIAVSGSGVAPPSCTYALSIGSIIDGYPNGGSFPVTVTTESGCPWTASTTESWIHVPTNASGSGTGTFTFTTDANSGTARIGALTIAGQTVMFNQTSSAAPCHYALSPGSQETTMFGGAFTFTATPNAENGCSWTASTATPWITITGATSGASSGTISYSVAQSNWPIVRTGMISVQWSGGSATFVVTQAAVVGSCNSPITISVSASQLPAYLGPIGQGCVFLLGTPEIDVPWIDVRGTGGAGAYLDVVIDINTGPQRTGHITYRGYDGAVILSITIIQAAGS